MAKNVNLAALKTRVRQRADCENDPHVSDSEITNLINSAKSRFYDLLVAAGPPDYFRTTYTFTTTSGTTSYALPSDFYLSKFVYSVDDTNIYRPLYPIDEAQVYQYRPPDGVYTVRLDYIPVSEDLSVDADYMDGVNSWDEIVVLQAAIDIKSKKEDSAGVLQQKLDVYIKRLKEMAERDWGNARRVVAKKYRAPWGARRGWMVETSSPQAVNGYMLVGGNIELYRFTGPVYR